jgi:DNA-binding transcriptional regulator YhcF (GntR family)
VPIAKIQLKGQFTLDRDLAEPLSLQLVHQLQEAIEAGLVASGTRLPSTRALARTLGISRNTVLTAYEELAARGFVRGRRGAGVYVFAPVPAIGVSVKSLMRDAQYPSRTSSFRDQDQNPLYINY